ncbi:DUF2721 domain-containing protein [Dictyobacter arantiisoli]|uniref:DUF2721 domain-containing protein n=1 Tax=Dictyobacter arantiisoli TaxID=2014874 RepID=A0A5A5TFG2_9CHLR|nr:DUF2721 domain-containing protein [Dictyobacter arantiisoli]GCF10162.1 hypothetical protein KDI_37260 [Dictyobacter arantiisoli]
MDMTDLIRTISLIVAPVVMISCCILFLNGQLQRYDGISVRMRAMTQERFDLLRTTENTLEEAIGTMDEFCKIRIDEIDAQLPHLLRRHKLIHDAALLIGIAIMIFVISMFLLAMAAMQHSDSIATVAFMTFLGGVGIVWCGGVVILYELNKSHLSIRYEVIHSLSLGEKTPSLTLSRVRVPQTKASKKYTISHKIS